MYLTQSLYYILYTYLCLYISIRTYIIYKSVCPFFLLYKSFKGVRNYLSVYRGLTKRVREMSSQLFVTLYTISIYPSKQLRRHLLNNFREFPCIFLSISIIYMFMYVHIFQFARTLSINMYIKKCFQGSNQFLGTKAPLEPASSEGLYVCMSVCLYITD